MRITEGRRQVEPIRSKQDLEKIYSYLDMRINTAKTLGGANKHKRNKIIIQFGMNTGLRISDILDFKVEDIKTKNILIKDKKTEKLNSFVLHEKMYELVWEYIKDLKLEDNDYLFTNQRKLKANGHEFSTNKQISKPALHYIFKDIQKYCKLDYEINTHSLRKTFGYHHYQKNKDIFMVMKLLNHTDVKVTQKYIGLLDDDKNKSRSSFTVGI
jgi:integrase